MYYQLESTPRALQNVLFSHLAEWWPAALLGILALMGGLPDANAATIVLGF